MGAGPSPERLAEIIDMAPGWSRVGITAPDPRVRAAALGELAAFIAAGLEGPEPSADIDQLALAL